MYPHAHTIASKAGASIRSRSAGFAQPARCAGAERCSAKPLLNPPGGAQTSFGAALQED
jgi:hypothetical protein